jgi:NlpC/P60 family putative phage cell wall peptidase
MAETRALADPARVVAIAERWLGTPYIHQASGRGLGTDCLGLARGIWRDLHGAEPVAPPPYTRDWGESSGREVMWEAAQAFLIEIPVGAAKPGALILFRMVATAPAKHCGILVPELTPGGTDQLALIHARETTGVTREPFTLPWRRRAVAAFLFPG